MGSGQAGDGAGLYPLLAFVPDRRPAKKGCCTQQNVSHCSDLHGGGIMAWDFWSSSPERLARNSISERTQEVIVHKQLFLAVFFGASTLLGQANSQDAEKEITGLEQQMVQMDIKNDYPQQFINEHVSSDLTTAWPMGISIGREHFTDTVPGQQILDEKLDRISVKTFGNVAVINGRWWKKVKNQSGNGKVDEFHGFMQHTWINNNGKWQLIAQAAGPLFEQESGSQGDSK